MTLMMVDGFRMDVSLSVKQAQGNHDQEKTYI